MPLTNAEKQKRTRQRKAEKLSKWGATLVEIAETSDDQRAVHLAHNALYGDLRAQLQQSVRQGETGHD